MKFFSIFILFLLVSGCGSDTVNSKVEGVRIGNGTGECGLYQIIEGDVCLIRSIELNGFKPISCDFATPELESEFFRLKGSNTTYVFLTINTFQVNLKDRVSIVKMSDIDCED